MNILALDIETLGIEPENGVVLQVALWHIGYGTNFSSYVSYPRSELRGELGAIEMHQKSGLLERSQREGRPWNDVMDDMWKFVNSYIKPSERATLLGKNVQFDVNWLSYHGCGWVVNPRVTRHRQGDVGNLWWNPRHHGERIPDLPTCIKDCGLIVDPAALHDAKIDVEITVKLWLRAMLGRWPEKLEVPTWMMDLRCPSFEWST